MRVEIILLMEILISQAYQLNGKFSIACQDGTLMKFKQVSARLIMRNGEILSLLSLMEIIMMLSIKTYLLEQAFIIFVLHGQREPITNHQVQCQFTGMVRRFFRQQQQMILSILKIFQSWPLIQETMYYKSEEKENQILMA